MDEQRFYGRVVILDRGKKDDYHLVLIGGVLGSKTAPIQDPEKAELWEGELIFRPIRKLKDFTDGNGASLNQILTTGLAEEEKWKSDSLLPLEG